MYNTIGALERAQSLWRLGVCFRAMKSAFVLVLLVGCASNKVVSIGQDTFMLADSSPISTGGEITVSLYREANAFCAEKKMRVVTMESKARFGSAELKFRCGEERAKP